MSDDYYVSQFSGEEWDSMLAGAAGAVRFDKAQALTAAQQTQARDNIGSAPDGYGLGSNEGQTAMDFDQLTKNGWYTTQSNTANAPVDPSSSQRTLIGALHVVSRSLNTVVVQTLYVWQNSIGFNRSGTLRRIRRNGTWEAWEWIDPPMELTAEYRTTERYLGKPVYVKAVNFGSLPDNGTKSVQLNVDNILRMVDCELVGSNSESNFTNFPGISSVDNTALQLTIQTTKTLSAYTVYALIKYIKTTD